MKYNSDDYSTCDWKATPSDKVRIMPKPPVLSLGKVLKWTVLGIVGFVAGVWAFHSLHGVGNIL